MLGEVARWYGGCPAFDLADDADEAGPILTAHLRATPQGWGIDVDARASLVVDGHRGVQEAIRRLNHEVLHGLMLRRPDLFFVHAGVVAVAEAAVILPGLSRAGKSTLVLALVEAGARLLSDEVLAYDPRTRSVLPVPRAIKIRDACLRYFSGLAPSFVGTGEMRCLPMASVHSVGPAYPALLVAPYWDPEADNEVEALTLGGAVLELTKSALNFGTHREQSIDHLDDIA
ncbi:MAG TPA: hypothetical protein PKE00_07900, partial [Planctomycetota bacterium]|nr:hypothetical protein [Planctomycetota bacterium]